MAKRLIPSLNRVLVEKIVPPSKTNAGILLPEKSSKASIVLQLFLNLIMRMRVCLNFWIFVITVLTCVWCVWAAELWESNCRGPGCTWQGGEDHSGGLQGRWHRSSAKLWWRSCQARWEGVRVSACFFFFFALLLS